MAEKKPLPEGWVWTTIGEIADINPRDHNIRNWPDDLPVTFVPMASVDGENGIIAHPQERTLKEVRKGYRPFSDGDVIFAKITPCMENGKAAIATQLRNGKGFGSTEFHVLHPKEIVTPKWLFHFVRQDKFRKDAKAHFAGTAGQLRVPASFLVDYPIPLPPASEQERIVARIEELFTQLDAGTDALRRVQAKLKRYKASVLKAACEGRLVEQDPRDEPAEEMLRRFGKSPQKNVDLPLLPLGWAWATLRDLSYDSDYGTSQKCDYVSSKTPVIRIPNIVRGGFDFNDIKYATKPNELSREKALEPNDFLIIRTNGSKNLIGRSSLVQQPFKQPTFFASYLIRYRLVCSAIWISTIWDSDIIRTQIEQIAATSAGQYNVSISSLNNIFIPLPPNSEQNLIVAEVEKRLSVVAEIEAAIEASLKRAERLRQSILKRAFEGKLVGPSTNGERINECDDGAALEQAVADQSKKVEKTLKQARLF